MLVGEYGLNSTDVVFISLFFYGFCIALATCFKTRLNTTGIFYVVCLSLGIFLVVCVSRLFSITLYQQTIATRWVFVKSVWYLPELGLNLRCDSLSFFFVLLVSIIGFCTNLYILNYFKYEANEDNFILQINFFIFSMLLFVLANNFFTLFLGWELIGLTSFLLINFWSDRIGTFKSAFKAFAFNKLSDVLLFFFIISMWRLYGTTNIHLLNGLIGSGIIYESPILKCAGIALVLCSSIKSAQIFGHLWLPDSMEAPVPASALIHSATLVSAGLYLLLRFNPLILSLGLHYYIMMLGAITAAYGGLVAASQTDMKKLLAYSTISHCGFLFVCVALQNYYLIIIYLFTHGIYKALTFFASGSFIRFAGTQDTRQMGGLARYLPVDTIYLVIASINLGGLPLTFGYLYKNLFLTVLLQHTASQVIIGLCFIGMLSSVVYVYRLVYYSCFDYQKNNLNIIQNNLQNTTTLEKDYSSFSTLVQSISTWFLLLIGASVYIFFYTQASTVAIEFNSFPIFMEPHVIGVTTVGMLYNFYTNLFYILYIVIILVVIFTDTRNTYTWDKKVTIFGLAFIYIYIFNIFFILASVNIN